MSMHHRSLTTLSAAALLALISAAPVALADDDLLRGPTVRQSAPPGGPAFTQTRDPFMRAAAGQPLPYRMFLMAVRTLEPGRAAPEIALSEEQGETIRAIQTEHNQALIQYIQLHRAELQTLIAKAELPAPRAMPPDSGQARPNERPNARPGNRPADDAPGADQRRQRQGNPGNLRDRAENNPEAQARQQAMRVFMQLEFNALPESRDPAVNAARARLVELRKGAPSQEEARAKVWAILNEAQQQHVLAVTEKTYRERAERQRANDMTDNQQRPARPAAPPAPDARPGTNPEATPQRNPNRRNPNPGNENRRPQRPDA